MTPAQMITMVRNLALLTTGDISDADMQTFLQEGYNRLETQEQWPWLVTEAVIEAEIVGPAGELELDATVSAVLSVLNEDGENLSSTTAQGYEQVKGLTATEPTVWHLSTPPGDAPIFKIAPIPATGTRTFYLKVTETQEWVASSTSAPPFDSRFHTILVDWVLHRLWEREDDMERSDQYRMRYADQVQAMSVYYDSLELDRPLVYGEYNQPAGTNMPFVDLVQP